MYDLDYDAVKTKAKTLSKVRVISLYKIIHFNTH